MVKCDFRDYFRGNVLNCQLSAFPRMAEEASAALENLAVTDEAVGSLATPTGSLGSPTGSYDVADDDEEEEETGISAQLGVFLDSSGEKQILGRMLLL